MSNPPDGFLRELFNNLEAGILVANDDAVYVDANPAACKLFGRSRAEIVGRSLHDFIGGRVDEVELQWKAFLRDGSQTGVFGILLPDGSPRMFQFQAQANFVPGLHCSFLQLAAPAGDAGSEFLTVCAWTKRVLVDQRWISMEAYILETQGLIVSHGMSPHAFKAYRELE